MQKAGLSTVAIPYINSTTALGQQFVKIVDLLNKRVEHLLKFTALLRHVTGKKPPERRIHFEQPEVEQFSSFVLYRDHTPPRYLYEFDLLGGHTLSLLM